MINFIFSVRAHDDNAEQGRAQKSRDHDDDHLVPLGLPEAMQTRDVRPAAVQPGPRRERQLREDRPGMN